MRDAGATRGVVISTTVAPGTPPAQPGINVQLRLDLPAGGWSGRDLVFRDGVRSASSEPLLEGVPPIPAGEPIGGRFFPRLFDPQSAGVHDLQPSSRSVAPVVQPFRAEKETR